MSDETIEITEVQSPSALVFEFDHLVCQMRQASYEVLKSIFDDQDLQTGHMSRFGLVGTPAKMVSAFQEGLGVKKGTPKKVGDEICNGINIHLESGLVQVSDALRNIVATARERGMQVIGVTGLPDSQSGALIDNLDLEGLGISLWSYNNKYESFPRADAWLRLSKEKGLKAPICLALTTSKGACKAALTAGFRCAVIPDSFTSFDDFGGASVVSDDLASLDVKELFQEAVTN